RISARSTNSSTACRPSRDRPETLRFAKETSSAPARGWNRAAPLSRPENRRRRLVVTRISSAATVQVMPHRRLALLVLIFCGFSAAARAAVQSSGGDQYAGTWAGTWDGAGSGEFELTLEKKDGALTGRVAVTTEAGPYTADLKTVSFDGAKMNARYDFPLDAGGEVIIAATFESTSAKGTWSLRPKGQESEIAGGTWTVTKK